MKLHACLYYTGTMSRTVIDILEELENTAGTNAKKDILQASRNNELLKKTFAAAQDPYTVYYVNKFKMRAGHERLIGDLNDDDEVLGSFFGLLNKLSNRELTGNDAKTMVEIFMWSFDPLQQKWCQRILIHNLRCGVQESTVNKIWPGLIKSFSVALAATLKSDFTRGEGIKILEPVKYPVRVEPKLDGVRCVAVKKDGIVTFHTRNGSVLETLPRIKAALENVPYEGDFVLDGEAMGRDWNESTSVLMSSKTKKDDRNIFFNVFDYVPCADWIAQKTSMTYLHRIQHVDDIVCRLAEGSNVRQVPHVMAKNEEELKTFFAKCMNEGYEGVMLKTLHEPYKWDRSKNILKLKPCVTYEGVVVGWYEGRHGTKHENQFGGFHVVLPNGIVTRIGGGFNDAFRSQIQIEGPDSWIGKIVECEAQPDPLTKDGLTSDGRMRFPVYIRTRDESDVDLSVVLAGRAYKLTEDHIK